jgi:nucleoside-diphosphate-sugar epimerase
MDFSNLASSTPELSNKHINTAICCLGTTIKTAGSQEAFQTVDLDYVLAFAELAKSIGAKKIIVISSVGANPKSGNFYLQTKGKMETTLSALAFEQTHFIRPGLLMGSRKEFRLGEHMASWLMPALNVFLIGSLSKYRGIQMDLVAKAICYLVNSECSESIIENKQLIELADGWPTA